MTIRSYLQVLRKRWRFMLAFVVLGVIGGLAISFASPVTYGTTATSFVAIQRSSDDATSIYQTSQFAMQRVKSYTSVVNSPAVLQPVIDELKLGGTVADLNKRVSADAPPDTVLIDVTAEAPTAKEAADIANAVSVNLGREIERLESPRSGDGVSPVKVTLTVPASPPAAPVAPRKTVNLVLGLLLGLALGVVASVIRDTQDTTVRAEDIEELTGRTPLGIVGYNPEFAETPLVVLESGPSTEEFRTIRTNLQFTDVDHPPRRIVVTSAVASEGKTTVACNLALTLARSGSVCLVEADMRRPKVTDYLGLDGSIGLSNLLAGQYELDDVLVSWRRGTLMVLPAGTTPPDPSQLLASNTMTSLLERLTERYDYVIFDAPPVLPVSDAVILASSTDGVLFVSRFGSTRRDRVEHALEQLAAVRSRLIGTVLTFVPARSHRQLRGHDYSYSYVAPSASEAASDGSPQPGAEVPAGPGGVAAAPGVTADESFGSSTSEWLAGTTDAGSADAGHPVADPDPSGESAQPGEVSGTRKERKLGRGLVRRHYVGQHVTETAEADVAAEARRSEGSTDSDDEARAGWGGEIEDVPAHTAGAGLSGT
jgi:capsular exopolysaccharide synthesis family protein